MTSAAPFALLLLALAQAPAPPARVQAPATPRLRPTAEVKAAFLKLLDRPKVPLDPREEPFREEPGSGRVSQRLSFTTEKKADGTVERVPGLVVKPAKGEGRLPAVIVLHGTGGTKEGMRPWMNDLAARGFLALAIDARYHGERAVAPKGSAAYVEAITRARRAKPGEPQENPFYYDTCWDLWRTVDYLQGRADVDPDRIGMIGTSMGGIETWLAAAVDDRIGAAVPAIGVQCFRWGLENEAWQGRANTIKGAHEAAARDLGEPKVNARVCRELWGKIIPGILDDFDGPSMLRLFAPRPLLILNGERDPNCPIAGARLAFASAEKAYADAGASDRLKVDVAAGVGHAVTPEQRREALDWFEHWLKPRP